MRTILGNAKEVSAPKTTWKQREGSVDNFIREYLRQGLIDVGDNEERLETLRTTAGSLAADFTSDRALLVRFIRATFVPSVDPKSPSLATVSSMVEEGWETFVSLNPERKTPMLIAVGWQAVLDCVKEDTGLLPLVWYASANAIERGEIDECVRPAIGYVQSLGEEVESQACAAWRTHIDKPTKQVRAIALPEAKNTLGKGLLTATTTSGADNVTIENGNANPMDGTPAWGQHFAKYASHSITNAISSQQKAVVAAVQESFGDLAKKFNTIRDEAVRSHQAQNRRTELLWLAESQYSPKFGCGYADLKGNESAAALAFDVAEIASGLSPLSVEYFLAAQTEKFASASNVKLEAFVKELAKANILSLLPSQLTTPHDDANLLGLFEAAGEVNRKSLKAMQIPNRIGYPKTKTMTIKELARTLFREIKCLEFMGGELWP